MTKLMRLDLILQETGNQWKCLSECWGKFLWIHMIFHENYSNRKSDRWKQVSTTRNNHGINLEKAMATHCGALAWKIPLTEEPGGLQSMGSLWVGHNYFAFTFHFSGLEKEMTTHSSVLAGESQGQESLVGCRLWAHRVWHDWSNLAAAAAWH